MKRPHVCVIGAGRVGKRHVEALAGVSRSLSVSVVDPSAEALAEARALFDRNRRPEIAHDLSLLQDIAQLPKGLDIAIVATNADVRVCVVETLLQRHSIPFLILEKILFPRKSDYERIGILLGGKVTAWVNCVLRIKPFHRELKHKISKDTPETVTVGIETGNRYGLMTNAIHHADYFSYLAGSTDFTVDPSSVDPRPIPSKRSGFLELSGALRFSFRNGLRGFVMQLPLEEAPRKITVVTPHVRCQIDEGTGKARLEEGRDGIVRTCEAPSLRQSEMTGNLVEAILTNGQCPLTPYEESACIHLNLLEPVRKFLNRHGGRYPHYPFT